jgi:hypothetical protein
MKYSLTQFAQLAPVISGLAATVALFFVWRNMKTIQKSLQSNAYQGIHKIMMDLHSLLIAQPDLIPYIHGDKTEIANERTNATEKTRLDVAAEMVLDIFDNIYCQKDFIPHDSYVGFDEYMRTIFQKSLVLQGFLEVNDKWYSAPFIKHIRKEIVAPDIVKKALAKPIPPKS